MEVKTVVRCYFKTFGDFVTIYSTNVSHGGILVQSETPLLMGDQVRLEFKLRNDYPLIMGEGQVVGVEADGALLKFIQLDTDSEKFLNEVVKVKAAELKPAPGSPPVTYDSEVVQEEALEDTAELDDAFSEIQDGAEAIEEVDTGAFEDVDMSGVEETDDPFAEEVSPPGGASEATEEIDFSGLSLNSQTSEEDDPFGVPADDVPAHQPAEGNASGGEDAFEQQDDDPSGYEDVEQSPANPQALFEDLQEDAPAAATVTQDEPTIGGSTTIFERISVLKERRALLIGAGAGLAALVLGAGAWFFIGRDDKAGSTAPVAAVETAKVVAAPAVVTQATVAIAATSPTPGAAAATQPVATPVAAKVAPPPTVPPPAPVKEPAPTATQASLKTKSAVSRGPASKIVDVEAAADGSVIIRGDGAFRKVKHFTMSEPNRIVVDVYGVQKAFKGFSRSGKGAVAKIRPGEHEGKIRFVLDLQKEAGKIPAYELTSDGDEIVVRPGR